MANKAITLTPAGGRPLLSVPERPQFYVDADYELFGDRASVDFRSIRTMISRERWLILVVLLVALVLGVVSIYASDKVYRAETAVQLDQQAANVLGTQDAELVPARAEADRFIQTQVDILESRGIAASVADQLDLANHEGFIKETGMSEASPLPPNEQATKAVQDRMSVSAPRHTRVVRVYYTSENPQLAAKVANAIADTFVASNLQRRVETYAYSRKYLQGEMAKAKSQVEQSERALIAYARSVGLVDASGAAGARVDDGGRRSLTTANLVDLNAAYAQARSNRMHAQQRWQQAQSTPVMSLPEVLGNPAIQDLTRRRAELQAAYQEQSQRRKEDHPEMQQAAANIAELNRQISSLGSSIRTSINDQYRVSLGQEGALVGAVSQLKSATLSEQEKGVRYNVLKREVDGGRDLFNSLLARYNQISSQAGLASNNISIIDRAYPPTSPVYPRPALNLAAAAFAGLALGLLLAFLRQRMSDRVHDPDEIEHELHVSVLGVVPKLHGRETMQEALAKPHSPIVEAHHSICMLLDAPSKLPKHSVLVLTSTRPNEGKSTTAFKIATNLAASGRRVLLIDGDLRKGSLHTLVGYVNDVGLSELLRKEARFADVTKQSLASGLSFIGRGDSRGSAAGLLAGDAIAEVLQQTSEMYDYVIVDGPPVLGIADAPRLALSATATLFVVEAHNSSVESTRLALRRLVAAGANVIGVILTKFDARKAGANYGYNYDYGPGEEYSDVAEENEQEGPFRRGWSMLHGVITLRHEPA